MKNILLLTSVYPADDLSKDTTPVVHYFAREWLAQGYHIEVIHNLKNYPSIVYFILRIFKRIISRHYKFTFRTRGTYGDRHYNLDGISVHRFSIIKKFPLALYHQEAHKKQLNKIIDLIESMGFKPDIIIGHWANPQLFQVAELGKRYNARTCMVIHSDVGIIGKMYNSKSVDIINSIDIWGFRSNEIKNKFEALYGRANKSFLCYSGIPTNTITPPARNFEKGIRNFLFVGLLVPRKHPTVLIKAINKAFYEQDFRITFIGQGKEKANIQKLARKLRISDKVYLVGHIPRDEVFKMMQVSDCFIMISSPETFGLVYLEAMSMGCITIGSKGEGIDGIIQHSKNGFLCKAGDEDELSKLLIEISNLSKDELLTISTHAVQTTSDLTDDKVAQHYIESVISGN